MVTTLLRNELMVRNVSKTKRKITRNRLIRSVASSSAIETGYIRILSRNA
jgi:hypothetical protein